jgi:hypothetical protein
VNDEIHTHLKEALLVIQGRNCSRAGARTEMWPAAIHGGKGFGVICIWVLLIGWLESLGRRWRRYDRTK